jgi:uncharacterized membrane protein YccF (DUF307 family)
MGLKWWFLFIILVVALSGLYILITEDSHKRAIASNHHYDLRPEVHSICGFSSVSSLPLFNSSTQICFLYFVSDLYDFEINAQSNLNSTEVVCTSGFHCNALIQLDQQNPYSFCLDLKQIQSPWCSIDYKNSQSIKYLHPGIVLTTQKFTFANRTLRVDQRQVTSFDLGKHFGESTDCEKEDDSDSCIPSCDDPPSLSLSNCFSRNFSDASSMSDLSVDYTMNVMFSRTKENTRTRFSWWSVFMAFTVIGMMFGAIVVFIRELIGVRLSRNHIRRNLNFAMFGGGLVAWLSVVLLSALCVLTVFANPVGHQMLKLSRLWLCPYGKQTITITAPIDLSFSVKARRFLSLSIWYIACVPILISVHVLFFFVNSISLMSYSTHLSKVWMLIDVILHPFSRDFTTNEDPQDPLQQSQPPNVQSNYVPIEEEKEDDATDDSQLSRHNTGLMELEGVQEI